MKSITLLFLCLLLACAEQENTLPIIESLSITQEYKVINGVDPDLLSLDVYYNTATESKKPVVIWVHGGGWSIGDKGNQITDKVNLFQSLNYVFVSINYRLSPVPFELGNPDRIMYPTHNLDVAEAIKWVVDNIAEYGGDPDKIALLGHSAGAHLVALTGTNPTFLANVGLHLSNLKGVAAIDTEGYNVPNQIQDNNDLYLNAFGSDPNLNRQASPLFNIESGVTLTYPNFFIAKRGSPRRIAIADEFISALKNKGTFVQQVDGSIYDHSGINQAIGAPNEQLITNALIGFFAACFK